MLRPGRAPQRPRRARRRGRRASRATTLLVVAVVSGGLAARAGGAAATRPRFGVTSPAFGAGGLIPSGFTCDGEDVPPPLRWTRVPSGAAELALLVEDLDGPRGVFVHWVAWGIDPAAGMLPEGVVPAGVHEGRNGARRDGYLGPCPPQGASPHRYRFTLYALRRHLGLRAGGSAPALRHAIAHLVLATARLVGRYER